VVKFLIVRFSSIGDIILTTPVIRCLKEQVEGAEIHYLTKKAFYSVLEENPHLNKIHVLDQNLSALLTELKAENFDYIIDLHHNIRTYRVKRALKRLSFSFNKLNFEKWLMVNLKVNRLPNIHIVDRYLDTLTIFDVKNDQLGLDFYIHPDNEIKVSELPGEFHGGYIGLVIGARHVTKQLPDEKLVELIKKINLPILLLGGKEDKNRGDTISGKAGKTCLNVCGKYSLQQSASLVQQAKLIITHDTGLMHIASAYKKTILSIWGNTIPEFGMYPYLPGKESVIYEVKGLKCRPCSKIGFEKCPKKHFNCMNRIDIEAIANNARNIFLK